MRRESRSYSRKKRMTRIISIVIACFLALTMVLGTVMMFFSPF